jgi:hypothetical protein
MSNRKKGTVLVSVVVVLAIMLTRLMGAASQAKASPPDEVKVYNCQHVFFPVMFDALVIVGMEDLLPGEVIPGNTLVCATSDPIATPTIAPTIAIEATNTATPEIEVTIETTNTPTPTIEVTATIVPTTEPTPTPECEDDDSVANDDCDD